MSEFAKIKQTLSSHEKLERELNLKQLQINRLLTITQSINDNVKASGLFNMYSSFIGWEMGVKKMALFYKRDTEWILASSHGVDAKLAETNVAEELPKFNKNFQMSDSEHPLLGQFDVVIPVKHKDEPIAYAFIGGFDGTEDLYNKVQFITTITNIIAVAIENKRLFKRQIEQERMKKEMELAQEMQLQLVPESLPNKPKYQLSSIYRPHNLIGGDYFDLVEFGDEKIVFCIGDITGKGAAAALLMANFQANFHTMVRKHNNLESFITEINCSLCRATKFEKFITFFIAEYNLKTNVLKYVNAGHNPPFLAMNGSIQRLTKGGTFLGMFDPLPPFETGEVLIENDALILTFTDGLTDLLNESGDYLSEELVEEFVRGNYDYSAKEFNELLKMYIEKFKGDQTFTDDFTVLTCKVVPTA